MTKRSLIGCAMALLVACGGGDDGGDSSPEASGDTTSGDETAADGSDGEDLAAADEGGEAEPEDEDDGMLCLPVSRCHSFANQDCTLVDANGEITDEQFSAGDVREACPGERGVAEGVTECFSYVEMSDGCGRRMPELRDPEWPCGRTDGARCGIVM